MILFYYNVNKSFSNDKNKKKFIEKYCKNIKEKNV